MTMILSVIVPDDRPGMQHMLAKELQFIESEVVYDNWRSGLQKAQGDFVCLLEYDSGLNPGALQRQLSYFLDNPRFRKLAMVSPQIEFDDSVPMEMRYIDSAVHFSVPIHVNCMLSRTGIIGGAVIRRSSLLQRIDMISNDLVETSANVSLDMWEKGLRIMQDNDSIYYSPQSLFEAPMIAVPVSERVSLLWSRELIT